MEVRHLSTTLIGNWGDCPARAWRSYQRRLDMGDDNEGTDATRFGTVVHDTCESMHNEAMQLDIEVNEYSEIVSDEHILEVFDEHWRAGTCYDFDIYVFGRDKIVDFVRRTFLARLGVTVATELLFVWEVETNKIWFPETRADSESVITAIIERGNTPASSKIDRIDRYVDADNRVHIKVSDYKTNILPFARDYIENSKQLGMYHVVAKFLYPEAASIECIFDMLRHGRFPVEFGDEFIVELRSFLVNLWKQIKASEAPERKLNKYCRWCEIRSDCSEYAGALNSAISPIFTETLDTPERISALYDDYERLGDIIKVAKERQDEIKKALSAKIEKDCLGEPLHMGDTEYYFQQNPRYEYDKQAVFNILADEKCLSLLPGVMSISKTSVERGLKARPELRTRLETVLKKNFASPTLKRRKLKGNKANFTSEGDDGEH